MSTYTIPDEAPRKPCAACHATIALVYNPKTGKHIPVAVATGRSHFEDCTDPNRFSRHLRRVDRRLSYATSAESSGIEYQAESTTRQERLF